jgi:mercuric ion binding protein
MIMKTLKIFSLLAFLGVAQFSFAQSTKTETFNVSGNCGMCKSKIEKAAKDAGASSASWDASTKELTVSYKSTSTNTAKIQKSIAGVGYDNAGFKATEVAYKKLHGCCQYDRSSAGTHPACCSGDEKAECCKDGKCTKHATEADCCKDGKCSKEGHDGKDCCKKSQ